ncbi:Arylsulfatase [Planctomycetes bacterium Pan216]|uniref:Arylsulfatase n=1 Tax=Kolteria novifilia TaxID=2527975 RepID=A0A518AYQ3_9BACT|nr:Arylsulfatase [Planctomycetes bacterium Pan216]
MRSLLPRATTRRLESSRRWLNRAVLTLLGWLPVGLSLVSAPAAEAAAPGEPPNIIFINADDLGYGDLGCYGQKRINTPAIDRMATQGLRFTDFYAGSTVCAPSRGVLMTGYHVGHARIRGNHKPDMPLAPEDVTVAEVLKDAGYTTAIIGKWGLGEVDSTGYPTRQGFDTFFGYQSQIEAHNFYPEFLHRDGAKQPLGNKLASFNVAEKRVDYSHDLFTEEALGFIEENKDRRFFLYLPYTIPHANNEGGRATGDGMEIPDHGDYASKDWPNPEKGRAAMISRLDSDVGKILAKLDDLDLSTKTIVFFTSDNGPHNEGNSKSTFFDSNGPLRGIKRDLYEGGIRVPMIVRWPGKVPAGKVSDYPWNMCDVLPTLAAIAGTPAPEGIDGISVLPELLGEKQPPHPPMYWEFHERGFSQAARIGKWKGVKRSIDGPIEIYDLDQDLGEEKNVADEYPQIVEQMSEYLHGARTADPNWPMKKPARKKKNPTKK